MHLVITVQVSNSHCVVFDHLLEIVLALLDPLLPRSGVLEHKNLVLYYWLLFEGSCYYYNFLNTGWYLKASIGFPWKIPSGKFAAYLKGSLLAMVVLAMR